MIRHSVAIYSKIAHILTECDSWSYKTGLKLFEMTEQDSFVEVVSAYLVSSLCFSASHFIHDSLAWRSYSIDEVLSWHQVILAQRLLFSSSVYARYWHGWFTPFWSWWQFHTFAIVLFHLYHAFVTVADRVPAHWIYCSEFEFIENPYLPSMSAYLTTSFRTMKNLEEHSLVTASLSYEGFPTVLQPEIWFQTIKKK